MCLSFWLNDRRFTVLSLAGPHASLLPKKDAPGRLCSGSLIILWGRIEPPSRLRETVLDNVEQNICAASNIHPVPENLYQVESDTILVKERSLFQENLKKTNF